MKITAYGLEVGGCRGFAKRGFDRRSERLIAFDHSVSGKVVFSRLFRAIGVAIGGKSRTLERSVGLGVARVS